MKPEIILIGGGGHCKSCIDVIEQEGKYKIAGIVELPHNLQKTILGYEVIASDDDLPQLVKEYDYFMIALGQIRTAKKRIEIFDSLKGMGGYMPLIVSPFAYVSKHAKIGEGTIVMHHATINAHAQVGKNCIVNSKALIEHDALVEEHCHIATGAIINGGVRVGHGTFFGSNAVSREYIKIGENCTISAGSVIMQDIPPYSIIKCRHEV